jgi:hypothetical protein
MTISYSKIVQFYAFFLDPVLAIGYETRRIKRSFMDLCHNGGSGKLSRAKPADFFCSVRFGIITAGMILCICPFASASGQNAQQSGILLISP